MMICLSTTIARIALLIAYLSPPIRSIPYVNGLLSEESVWGLHQNNRKLLENLKSNKIITNVIVTEAGNFANATSKLTDYYKHILRNNLCHLEKFKTPVLIYIIGWNQTVLSIEEKILRKQYPAVTISLQTYPKNLFWSFSTPEK